LQKLQDLVTLAQVKSNKIKIWIESLKMRGADRFDVISG
jgi:hypothetical protein